VITHFVPSVLFTQFVHSFCSPLIKKWCGILFADDARNKLQQLEQDKSRLLDLLGNMDAEQSRLTQQSQQQQMQRSQQQQQRSQQLQGMQRQSHSSTSGGGAAAAAAGRVISRSHSGVGSSSGPTSPGLSEGSVTSLQAQLQVSW
jgi:hypothetical protein